MSETFQRLDKSFSQNPKDLGDLINKENQIPNVCPNKQTLEALLEKYILLDSLLFRIYPEKETAVLAIPESCTDKIITLYHKSLFAGHQGIIKTYLAISDKFFIPNLTHYHSSYIKGCHICQLSRNEKPHSRHLQTRINPNYVPMSRLSMELKVMPRLLKGHRYILCIIDAVMNFLIMVPIFSGKIRGNRRSTIRKCYNKILHTRIYNNGSRQCIYVLTDDVSLS